MLDEKTSHYKDEHDDDEDVASQICLPTECNLQITSFIQKIGSDRCQSSWEQERSYACETDMLTYSDGRDSATTSPSYRYNNFLYYS